MKRVAVIIGDYPPVERKRREDAALAYSNKEVEVGIVSVRGTPYQHGVTPAEVAMIQTAYIESYVQAARAGYDAIVPLGTLNLGVEGGRSVVDIPVIAPSEAMLHIASMVGRRFGLIVYHKKTQPLLRRVVEQFHMEDRVVGWRFTGFDLPDIAANEEEARANIVSHARSLVEDDDCDVILPMGITQCPVWMSPDYLSDQCGVPVVEGIGAPIRLAAMMADLGIAQSRRYWPKSTYVGPG